VTSTLPGTTAAPTRPELSASPALSSGSGIRELLEKGTFSGTLFQTYVLFDLGHELLLLDQHAAHERVRYEKLRARALQNAQSGKSQPLLIPEAVHFASESRSLLESRLPWLERLGFEAEVFGESALLFRTVPAEWGSEQLRTRLKSLVERLLSIAIEEKESQNLLLDESRFEKLASEACPSAIRAGDRLERVEVDALVEELIQCEHPWNCPHGRPTVARIPRSRFEEWFQRRV
jgi:DNA mismatch repair protein MutL